MLHRHADEQRADQRPTIDPMRPSPSCQPEPLARSEVG
jgi:hypothetical protein